MWRKEVTEERNIDRTAEGGESRRGEIALKGVNRGEEG